MSFFWWIICLISMAVMVFIKPGAILTSLTDGGIKAIGFCLSMLPIYAIWLGIIEVMDKSKLTEKLAKFLLPVITFLFGVQNQKTRELLANNIAGNLIGIGAVATPSGIDACKEMQGKNESILPATIMLIILNTSSLQIVPTTVITMLAQAGSKNPQSIFLPTIVTSIVTTLFAVTLVKLFSKIKRKKA